MRKTRDGMLKSMIIGEVRCAMQTVMEEYNERYVSADELIQQFGFLTKSWLKEYGDSLPRTEAKVLDEDDNVIASTRPGYAVHAIARMIASGEIKQLRLAKKKHEEKKVKVTNANIITN